jgi:hypothetical protein
MTMYRSLVSAAGLTLLLAVAIVPSAEAASSRDCEGGGWRLTTVGTTLQVRGRHVEFDFNLTTGAIRNWTLTGAPNPGRLVLSPTVIFLEKTPLHGAVLNRTERLRNREGDLVITRTNGDVSVKIQAKDCSQGGVFQMEVELDSADEMRVRHVLAPEIFFFDNPNFREREGDVVPFTNGAGESQDLIVTPRINFASDASELLVGRDSPQAATRVQHPTCTNNIPRRDGTLDTVRHCGGVSEWIVLSGGRMGQVMGEDATEVAPPATFCVQDCQAQNQVRGGAVVLGHPFPVPQPYRLQPRTP